ncbi:MAG TPA: di-heme oxidoredictase family protein [Terriglobales bacterium]|nr:di-heme oxidoredictase family protein [Terriglobales bacterium]
MFLRAKAISYANPNNLCPRKALIILVLFPLLITSVTRGGTQTVATDPGVRGSPAGAGAPIAGLTANQTSYFNAGLDDFMEIQSVLGTIADTSLGLGPRFNGESCGQCHAQPAVGGTSPSVNPQVAAASDQGATNQLPFFITLNGPVREARFPFAADLRHADGGVHDLFTITGRSDAKGCTLAQPDFRRAAAEGNLVFRIPTPVFGGGLIEAISDSAILANMRSQLYRKRLLGIRGRPNTNGNDGSITRFGWKAQNKSLQLFAAEAYNVEMGITNEIFPNERDETPSCQFNGIPEDATHFDADGTEFPSDVVKFVLFMRLLDQPKPAPSTPSIESGRQVFQNIGCALCHTPSLRTEKSSVAALSNVDVNLFSDLLLHRMGPGLHDHISQGVARGDEFRTAPLWGLGQRIFFLHDGRTTDLVKAIQAHASNRNAWYPDSESNAVIANYNRLSVREQQDLLNFLRSL